MSISFLNKKYEVIITAFLFFVLNFFLKILFVSANDIAMDEPFSIYYAQMDLSSIFTMLKTENNPPLHFLLLHYWIKAFGISPLSVRFLSVLFSALTAPLIYFIGQKFFSKQTGLIAGLIFTLSYFHMYFSHEARVYPIFVFLTALCLYYFLSVVNRPERWKPYIGLLIVNVLLVYSHYFGFFVVATEFVCIFFAGNLSRIWKKMSLVFFLLMLAYIPNALILWQRFSISVGQGTWVRQPEFTELYGNLNRFMNSKMVMAVLLVVAIIYIVLLIRDKQFSLKIKAFFRPPFSRILLIWFVFPYLAMFFLSFWAPMFLDRYIIFISISFYLLIALFLATFTRYTYVKTAGTIVLLILMALNLNLAPDNNRRVKQLAGTVKELKAQHPKSIVIISPEYSHLEFTYHFNINYFKDYNNTKALLQKNNIFPLRNLSSADKIKIQNQEVIYVDCGTEFAFGESSILADLNTSHTANYITSVFEIYRIYLFSPGKQ
ncbi:MAG TPA: glycosyltransferase family 39 protein [Bacteroidales bacterium]|nr:glycosyltransferase family 39 protein [Bacteroidales bacterium]